MPDFWLAILALLTLTYWLPIFPVGGAVDPVMHEYMGLGARIADRLRHLALPAITLTVLAAASVARYQRAALLDVLPADFIRTARLKGLTERQILRRHALRNALLPIITLIGLSFPALLTGAFFIERIFAWPGMGYAVITAISSRDYPLVVGGVIIGSIMVTLGSLLADLLYVWADPLFADTSRGIRPNPARTQRAADTAPAIVSHGCHHSVRDHIARRIRAVSSPYDPAARPDIVALKNLP